jgi:D-alanyl-D-alanine carboxypeptidase/D-alanyl-D-alanine-endopeptidase (penicillin-binding protein 4)
MLQAAWHSPYAAEYISSMPIAGTDGTMRKRLKTTAMRGEAHVKTGTLNTVRAIAGFSRDVNGNTWAVVAILNDKARSAPRRCWIRCCWICTASRSCRRPLRL